MNNDVRHAELRHRTVWPSVQLDRLELVRGGELELRRVPRVEPAYLQPVGSIGSSGLASDGRSGIFLTDLEAGRIEYIDRVCGDRTTLDISASSWLQSPIGCCIGSAGRLLVLDGQGPAVVALTPDLQVVEVWSAGLANPTAIASDGFITYMLDTARILMLGPSGKLIGLIDVSTISPTAIAVSPSGVLYVAGDHGTVLRFNQSGVPTGTAITPGAAPAAIAASSTTLYVADRISGSILCFATESGEALGAVQGYSGPVSALALDPCGALLIKPSRGCEFLVADPLAGRSASGVLTTRVPCDAGLDLRWYRAVVEASTNGGHVTLEYAVDSPDDPPVWTASLSLDVLLPRHYEMPEGAGDPYGIARPRPVGPRYVSLRVTLHRRPDGASPSLKQVRLETEGDAYLNHLPAVYDRDPSSMLEGILGVGRAEFGDLELQIAELARRLTTTTATIDELDRLADWLAFPLPSGARDSRNQLAALIDEVPDLYASRGTIAGLRRLIKLHTGLDVTVVEDFSSRGIWVLDELSALGFDTMLPSSAIDGFVVGDGLIGESGPEADESWGSSLFAPTAHRFAVITQPNPGHHQSTKEALRQIVDAEKPAHTHVHLCHPLPSMRVGFQARLGVDAMLGDCADELRLDDGLHLGVDTISASSHPDLLNHTRQLALNSRLK